MNDILKKLEGDKVIWAVIVLLSMISILVVYSATGSLAYKNAGGDTERYLFKHGTLVGLGLITTYICHKIDYVYYSRISRYILLICVPMLLFTWQFGANYNQASRWIEIPFLNYTFQPSDLAKLALITNMASMLWKRQRNIDEFKKSVIPLLIWTGVICGLIGLSDVSTACLLFVTVGLLLFIGRVPIHYLGILLIVGVIAGAFAYEVGQRKKTTTSRLSAFMSKTEVPYQAQQSYIAIASGGITGKGAGQSTQRNFLPHSYSDFIFAIIVEEYGLLGGGLTICLYLLLLYRGISIVSKSQEAFGGLLAAGITFSLILQAFVHMAVVVGLMPLTGLPLPLLSMGGTSLVFTGMAVGILLSVSRGTKEINKRKPATARSRSNQNRPVNKSV